MAELGTLIEVGPRLRWTFHLSPDGSRWRLDLPLRGVVSLSDGLAHRGMAFEPEVKWQGLLQGGWFVNTGLSAVVGDERLARTYYGVPANQATTVRPAYTASAGLISTRLSVAAGRRIAPQWNAFVYGRVDTVAGAANRDSPLVRQSTGGTVGVGLSYVWKQSDQPAMP
jgi:outer membrane scaffolding protein for murein synthesis (MipA/OmpV family)